MTTLHLGDCLEVMRTLPDCSVHAIVTDPPYGLAFMGKKWDYDVPSVDVWAECLRVLKPGGHLLAFAGTRTQHRMACRIEDAGFEIRDMIAWVYGSGFPKSLDVSKAIDKAAGAEREVVKRHVQSATKPDEHAGASVHITMPNSWDITAPATPEAQQWAGWGTALKPALEPITLARKPFPGTVAANVLEHGTGAINVDGCRVAGPGGMKWETPRGGIWATDSEASAKLVPNEQGRWPANLIHDGSGEVVGVFPETASETILPHHQRHTDGGNGNTHGKMAGVLGASFNDSGSAARFFYTAKASKAERGHGNNHPTVKPLDLMAYLCRLVTPPGGTVLDPFMGSGTTIKAALSEGFDAIGIERDPAYYAIAQERLNGAQIGLALVA